MDDTAKTIRMSVYASHPSVIVLTSHILLQHVLLLHVYVADKEVGDWMKNLEKVEKGEAKIMRNVEIRSILKTKVESYVKPFEQLQLDYGGKNTKHFTEAEDRYLVCMMQQLG